MKSTSWVVTAAVGMVIVAGLALSSPGESAQGSVKLAEEDPGVTPGPSFSPVPTLLYLPAIIRQPTPTPTSTSTPTQTPTATRTPTVTPTWVPGTLSRISDSLSLTQPSYIWPNPNPQWYIPQLHQLTCEENHGMLRLKVVVLDQYGNPLNGVPIIVNTMDGQWRTILLSGSKELGTAEYSFETSNHTGGRWKAEIEGGASDIAMDLATDLPDDPSPNCNGGNTRNHYSYDVTFRKVR